MLIAIIVIVIGLIAAHYYLYKINPYTPRSWFKSPYRTNVVDDKIIVHQNYTFTVHGSKIAGLFGYYVSGFLIARNTFLGSKPAHATTETDIISEIHNLRFDPDRPYLISGDQFSVLYPRNLGVFYNQLLDPEIALNKADWQHKQQIYLQSVLVAIDGLSASDDVRTTIVPIGRRRAVLTQVHPGGVGSDQVYGLLYALHALHTQTNHPLYKMLTIQAVDEILMNRREQLQSIVNNYLKTVQDPQSGLIRTGLHMASARDGVIRSSSLYDNIILWKTLQLASQLGIAKVPDVTKLRAQIVEQYWNTDRAFYNDDVKSNLFSADWLIGFPTGFFDLTNPTDLQRTIQIVTYIEASNLAKPFPIKYQEEDPVHVPWFVKAVVPSYGGSAIWSYWGAEYITLLMRLHDQTQDDQYLQLAQKHQASYAQKIVEDRGFPETFDENGVFLRTAFYKSIRLTGWVVQYEHAVHRIAAAKAKRS